MGDDFLVQKLPSCLFMCLTIIMFCAGSNPIFSVMLSLWTLMIFRFGLFSTVAFYAYFTVVLRLIFHLIFRNISLKSQEYFCLICWCISFSSQVDFICFNSFIKLSLSCPIIFVYLFVIIRLFIRILLALFHHLFYFFELFSCSYLFIISCLVFC